MFLIIMSRESIYDTVINLWEYRYESYIDQDGDRFYIYPDKINEDNKMQYIEKPVIKCQKCYTKNYTNKHYPNCNICYYALDGKFLRELEKERLETGRFQLKEYKSIKTRIENNISGLCKIDIELSNGNKKFIIYYGYIDYVPNRTIHTHIIEEYFFIIEIYKILFDFTIS